MARAAHDPPDYGLELAAQLAFSASKLEEAQVAGLRQLMGHAARSSAFYARRLAHVSPERARPADLATIPPLTKQELMQHWDEIITVPGLTLERCEAHLDRVRVQEDEILLDGHRVVASGGSSGLRAVIVYGEDEWAVSRGAIWRWIVRWAARSGVTLDGEPVVAQIQSAVPTHMSGLLGLDSTLARIHQLPVSLPLPSIIDRLNALQPTAVVLYSSVLRALWQETRAGRLRISPLLVFSGGEPLAADDVEIVRELWDATAFDAYGSTEVGMIATSDGLVPGLYLHDDLAIIEVVDAEGRPVAPGQRSAKLYVTPLRHRTLPLLRYELTDSVTILDEASPDGLPLRRIDHIEGRADDSFSYAGIQVHPILFRAPITRRRQITAYQVRQTARGAEISVIGAGPVDAGALAREIADSLAKVGLEDPGIRVERVKEIPRTASGQKLRRFVPLPD